MKAHSEWRQGSFTLTSFQLESGVVLPQATTAYLTQGKLNAERSNVVLVQHGYTSSHQFVSALGQSDAEGSWSGLVGPGRAIDTDRYFVIAPNALGSCFGSTGPGSIDPDTGQPYGPNFPDISFRDIVDVQYQLLAELGVKKLAAVAGVSMGGFTTWQWGVQYPEFVDKLVVVLSSLSGRHVASTGKQSVLYRLQNDPHWNGGWIYDNTTIRPSLARLRKDVLLTYGAAAGPDADTAQHARLLHDIEEQAIRWASKFDPNSLVVLGKAMRRFDVAPELGNLSAPVFMMLATTDRLFPASESQEVLDILQRNAVRYEYLALETEYGHQASGKEWRKWEQALRRFLDRTA